LAAIDPSLSKPRCDRGGCGRDAISGVVRVCRAESVVRDPPRGRRRWRGRGGGLLWRKKAPEPSRMLLFSAAVKGQPP